MIKNANVPAPSSELSSLGEGSTTSVESSFSVRTLPTEQAHTTPRRGTDEAFSNASEEAFISAAMSAGFVLSILAFAFGLRFLGEP